MPIQLTCSCGKRLQVRDELAGKPVRCPGCSKVVRAPTPAVEPVPIPAPPTPAAPTPPSTSEIVAVVPSQSWLYPPKHESSLLTLTSDSLWIATAAFSSVRPQYERLQAREDPEQVLGSGALRIPLDAVGRISLDKNRANLVVHYREQVNDKRVEKRRELLIDDTVERDEIFAALSRRLGPAWTIRPEELSPLSVVGGHVVAILGTLLALPVALWIVHRFQGPEPGVFRLGGIGVHILIIGAAALAVITGIVMMVSHLRMPPLLWHLEKADCE